MSDVSKLTYITDRERAVAGEVKVPLKVHNYHLDCILSGAFEGGSNYWADRIKVVKEDYKGAKYASEVISHGGALNVYTQDEPSKPYKLTKKKMLKGCRLYVENGRTFDIDAWDAIDHDVILQYSLFDEVVYS